MKKILSLLMMLLGSSAMAASQYFGPGMSGVFTVPQGVSLITVQGTTGGGGGGGSCYGAGGAGGLDMTYTQSYNVTAGSVISIQTQWGGAGGCGGGGGGAGGSVWVTGPGVNFVAYGGNGGNGSGGGCVGGCGGKGGDSFVYISY